MRLGRMLLVGFGRFTGQQIDLQPGLNLLYGPNESGKSTLQKFILGMLYGFKKRAQRREFTEDALRYRPWSGAEYRGVLHYSLDAPGQQFRVERNFEPAHDLVKIYDAVTGADLTPRFPMDRRKEPLFAEQHLHMDAEVFTSTAWVGQLSVGRLEMGRELVQRVANLSESGREDLSVQAALRVLEERMREIGSERAPTRPYARVSRAIAEKQQELERALRTREQTLHWEMGLREAREALTRLDGQLAEARRRLTWAQLAEAEEREARLSASMAQMEVATERARELSAFASFPADLRPRLLEHQAQVRHSEEMLAARRARLAAVEQEIADLQRRLEPFAALAALGPEGPAEVAAAVRRAEAAAVRLPGLEQEAQRLEEMIARLDEAIAPLAEAAAAGDEAMAEIDRIEEAIGSIRQQGNQATVDRLRGDVARLERQARSSGGKGWLLAGLALGGLAAAVQWLPAVHGLLPAEFRALAAGGLTLLGLLALMLFYMAWRLAAQVRGDLAAVRRELEAAERSAADGAERIRRLEKQRDQTLRRLGVVSVGELRNQVVRYEQLTARRDGQAMRLEAMMAEVRRAREEIAQHEEQVEALFSASGVAATPGDEDRAAHIQQLLDEYRSLRSALEAAQRERAELARDAEAAARQLRTAQAEVAASLSRAGVDDLEGFEAACARHEEWQKAQREAEGLRAALEALVGGSGPEEAAQEVERLRSRVQGQPPEGGLSAGAIQAEIGRLEAERSDWLSRASDLSARLETAVAETADTADLEREVALLTAERAEMEEELAALDLARTVISEVSSQIHREAAPRLNRAMGDILAQVTGGRYRAVRIDEDLTIRAIAAGERMVELGSLSGGTVDQFYLALRVAMLDLLTEGQETLPLLLDDPFVQYDNERMEAAMGYLAQVAENRQVVIMTCHRRELEVGQALGAHVLELG